MVKAILNEITKQGEAHFHNGNCEWNFKKVIWTFKVNDTISKNLRKRRFDRRWVITVVAVVYTSDSAVTSWSYILEQTSDRDTLRGVKLKEDVRQADNIQLHYKLIEHKSTQ